jgi:PIN like domain
MGGRIKKLRKQLDGSPDQSQPDQFILFLDETIHNCKPVHAALTAASIPYERQGAHYPPGLPDDHWLPEIGTKRCAMLTCDQKIRYNELERQKIVRYKIREFVFAHGNMSGAMMGAALTKAAERMKLLVASHPPPFIGYISQSGNVAIRYDKDGSVHDRRRKEKSSKTNLSPDVIS